MQRPPSPTRSLLSPWRGAPAERTRFLVLVALLAICFLGGGSARIEVYSLLFLRPAVALCLTLALLVTPLDRLRPVRAPLILLGLFAAVMAAQLVPLPPSIWQSLPNRAPLSAASALIGGAQPWRPISLTPDLTINSLVSLLVPAAVLIAHAGLRPDQSRAIAPLLVVAALLSCVLGVAQIAGGSSGGAHLYKIHSRGALAGVFANRNHQAVLLAIALLALGWWARGDRNAGPKRLAVAAAGAAVLVISVLATGSRSGMILSIAALVGALAFAAPRSGLRGGKAKLLLIGGFLLAVTLIVGAAVLGDRALSIERLAALDADDEQRFRTLPVMIDMLRAFMPVGIGFGAFDPAFRWFEPDRLLHPQYFNHAHNDWLELLLTGGIPAALVLAAFVVWTAAAGWRVLRRRDADAMLGRVGLGAVLLLGAASVSDYPLRTPLLAAVFALACAWLASAAGSDPSGADPRPSGRRLR